MCLELLGRTSRIVKLRAQEPEKDRLETKSHADTDAFMEKRQHHPLGLQIAKHRQYLHALGLKASMMYILGASGCMSATSPAQ